MLSTANKTRTPPDMDRLPPSAYITGAQLGALISSAEITVRLWRRQGKGPRVTMIEGRPRYRVADVAAWLKAS